MEWVARGQDTVTIFLGIMIEATPFLVLGVLVSQALALVVREGEMVSWVPRGRLASLSALAGLGALFPVCECGNVPVARRLLSRGVPVAAAMVFLLSAPALNPVVALSTYAAFRDLLFDLFIARRFNKRAVLVAVAVLPVVLGADRCCAGFGKPKLHEPGVVVVFERGE